MIWGLLIPGWLKRAAIGIAVAAAGAIGFFIAGKREGKRDAAVKDAKEYAKTRKRIDNAKGSAGNTSDDVNWLHDYGDK